MRAQIKTRIQDLLTDASAVPVFRGFPPAPPDELIWLSSTQGGLEYAVMGANLPRDDRFTVTVIAMSWRAGDDPGEAEQRVEEIGSTIVTALADETRLDDDESDEFSIFDALISTVDGPDCMPGPDGEGWDAFMRINVDIHLRITREQ